MDTLSIKPNIIYYAGIPLKVVRLIINGQEISDETAPFKASDSLVHPTICYECYASGSCPSCGDPFTFVRRQGEFIYWCLTARGVGGKLSQNAIWKFSKANYESIASGSTAHLPVLTSQDIASVLTLSFPHHCDKGIYSIPELRGDSQGRGLLYLLEDIFEAKRFSLCSEPTQYRTITIGVEGNGVSECVVDVGMAEGRCCIRFSKTPTFSAWITSAEIHRSMTRYLI